MAARLTVLRRALVLGLVLFSRCLLAAAQLRVVQASPRRIFQRFLRFIARLKNCGRVRVVAYVRMPLYCKPPPSLRNLITGCVAFDTQQLIIRAGKWGLNMSPGMPMPVLFLVTLLFPFLTSPMLLVLVWLLLVSLSLQLGVVLASLFRIS